MRYEHLRERGTYGNKDSRRDAAKSTKMGTCGDTEEDPGDIWRELAGDRECDRPRKSIRAHQLLDIIIKSSYGAAAVPEGTSPIVLGAAQKCSREKGKPAGKKKDTQMEGYT